MLLDVLKKQTRQRYREHGGKRVLSVEDALEKNYQLGIIDGLRLAANLPKAIIELEKEELKEWLENERRNGTNWESGDPFSSGNPG